MKSAVCKPAAAIQRSGCSKKQSVKNATFSPIIISPILQPPKPLCAAMIAQPCATLRIARQIAPAFARAVVGSNRTNSVSCSPQSKAKRAQTRGTARTMERHECLPAHRSHVRQEDSGANGKHVPTPRSHAHHAPHANLVIMPSSPAPHTSSLVQRPCMRRQFSTLLHAGLMAACNNGSSEAAVAEAPSLPLFSNLKGVLFDVDGTLTNSDPLHFKA